MRLPQNRSDYRERVSLLLELKRLLGWGLFLRPKGINVEEALDALASALFVLLFPIIWVSAWVMSAFSPFYQALRHDTPTLRRSVEKWRSDLATDAPPEP